MEELNEKLQNIEVLLQANIAKMNKIVAEASNSEELQKKLADFEFLLASNIEVMKKFIDEYKAENEKNIALLVDSNAKLIELLYRYSNPKN